MNFDFLVEMAWKSALISGGALAVAAALRFRPAGERSAVLRTAVALILALPLIVLLLPALPVVTETVRDTAPAVPAISAVPAVLPPIDLLAAAAAPAAAPAPSAWDNPAPLLEWLWLGGAVMVVLRLLAGLATLRRWTRSASRPDSALWFQALDRTLDAADCRKPVRLLVGDTPSPISWGWHRPVVLLDRDTARNPSEADAVLAHEIAHIVRHDWATLIAARLAAACFWFNPLMWLLERRLIIEAEEAADARALASIEPETYAQTLLSCARQVTMPRLPATGIADRSLGRRVKTILARRLRVGAPEPRHVRAAMAVCALLAAPIAALKPVVATVRAQAAPQAPMPPAQPEAALAPAAPAVGSSAAMPTAEAPPAPAAALLVRAVAARAPAAPVAPRLAMRATPAALAARAAAIPAAPAAPAGLIALAAAAASPAPPAPPAPPRRRRGDDSWVDGQAIADSVREAVREATAAHQEALEAAERVRREWTPERIAEVRRAAEEARVATRRGLAAGAIGMEEGARGMERGARQMDEEAEKLRSPAYRAEQIARAERDGRTVTDAELIAAIPKLHRGAAQMRQGAERMRVGAERMRRGD